MKMYIIIRNDKKIPMGKIMAHVGHNVLDCYLNGTWNDRMSNLQDDWYRDYDQKKIVVSAPLGQLKLISLQAYNRGIPFSMVDDVNYKYPICAVIGPVTDEQSYSLGLADLPLYRG